MLVLTPENLPFDMASIVEDAPDELYCALNLSDISDSDYFFYNILNTVTFTAMTAELQIGDMIVQVPINWQILLGDEDTGMMEMSSIEDLLSLTEPHAFVYNPLTSLYPKFLPVSIKQIFTINIKWQMPMLSRSHLLAVPLQVKHKPLCAFFADENDKFPDFLIGE